MVLLKHAVADSASKCSRHGQLEDRDPYRLKDKNGDPVLCFKCGTSALPPGVAAAAPAAKRARRGSDSSSPPRDYGRSIISCDYCPLHWHLDCVDPPLASMPPWGKKWMCPNHADRIFVRFPSQVVVPSNSTFVTASETSHTSEQRHSRRCCRQASTIKQWKHRSYPVRFSSYCLSTARRRRGSHQWKAVQNSRKGYHVGFLDEAWQELFHR